MNQRDGIDGPGWVDAQRAAALLGVKRETLYAYASRGLVRSAAVPGSRRRRYHRADLDRLRARKEARAGHAAVAAGALRWGEPVLDSSLTSIAPEGHAYRGRAALELAREGAGLERVAELLWTGDMPRERPRLEAPDLGVRPTRIAALVPAGARSLDGVAILLPVLAAADPDRHAFTVERARVLVRRAAAGIALSRDAAAVVPSLHAPSVAQAFLTALGGRTDRRAVAAIDRALVLCADHELNASSFAARVAASAGADPYACMAAALATHSGPRHGGMCDRVEALLGEVGGPEGAVRAVRERLALGEALPGFGHPLYPDGDPRGAQLLDDATRLAPRSRAVRAATALVEAVQLAGGEPPSLDPGLVALTSALRLPAGSAIALFATGRTVGWLAHALEQRTSDHVIRPRARAPAPGTRTPSPTTCVDRVRVPFTRGRC